MSSKGSSKHGCTSVWSQDDTFNATTGRGTAYNEGNAQLIMQKVTVFARGAVNPPRQPHAQEVAAGGGGRLPGDAWVDGAYEPVLYGTDAVWLNHTLNPFLRQPCDAQAGQPKYSGWSGGFGPVSFKNAVEQATLGYKTCQAAPLTSIDAHKSAALYLAATPPSAIISDHKKGALHLLRRLHACHRGVGEALLPGATACQFSLADTARLRAAVISREMGRDWGHRLQQEADKYGTKVGAWWWDHVWLNAGGFDLATSGAVTYYTQFIDILRPYLSSENITAIEGQMSIRIDMFLKTFDVGGWALWNGNNWTPILCSAAVHWVVQHWRDDNARARRVLGAVYDLLWLHPAMYTDARAKGNTDPGTVYAEGVSYSDLSSRSLLAIGETMLPSFGEVPPALAAMAPLVASMPSWLLWNMATDGTLVPFGDSHRKAGWNGVDALRAMMAEETLHTLDPNATAAERAGSMSGALASKRACEVRSWFMNAYFQGAGDPFRYPPELAKNWSDIISSCRGGAGLGVGELTATGANARQLGGGGEAVYVLVGNPSLCTTSAHLGIAGQGACGVHSFLNKTTRQFDFVFVHLPIRPAWRCTSSHSQANHCTTVRVLC